jgi:solute carrier family 25 (mitochondrial oxoglutarate transporter), member 11
MSQSKNKPLPTSVNFATAGIGGLIGWIIVHPFNTLGIRMNLASQSGAPVESSFLKFSSNIVKKEGLLSLYSGLSAGLLRQLFYATSRFGLFEVFRDELAKHRETDFVSRLVSGCTSGGVNMIH